MRDNPPFFNPLVTQQLLQNPFAAVTGALALGFDVALLLTLVGVRLAPTEHPNVGRSVGFGVVLALLAFAFVASLVFRIVSRYAAVSERIQEIVILRVLGASLPWLMNLLAQETPSQVAQFGDGFVMGAPFSGHINRPHCAEFLQIFQAMAGGTFAQAQPLDERVHRQRLVRNKKQSINFGHGAGLTQRAGELDKELDDLNFHRFEGWNGAACSGALLQFFGECPSHQASLTKQIICSI